MPKRIVLALLACGFLITGCGNKNDDGELTARNKPLVLKDGRTVLRRGNGAEPETLDPHRAQSVTSSNILRDLYEGLVGEAPDGRLVPGAAERWEISNDNKTYIFHLRKNARWSNGEPVTAEDFAYGLRRCVDPATGSPYAEILAPIANAKAIISGEKPPSSLGVKALDAHTLQISLKAPTPYFLGLLTHSSAYPAHRVSIEKHGDAFTQPAKHVSNGAYVLSEWVVASHITVEKNPRYWDAGNTGVDVVRYLPIDNADSEFKRYLAGELEMTGTIPISRLDWAQENLQQDYRTHPSLAVYYYGLNTTRPPFKDAPELRRALSLAVDRRIITEKVTRGGELPAYSWVPPGVSNYTPQKADYAQWPREKQIAKARKLYAQAGYSADNPLRVTLRYNTSEGHKKIATAIASMWKTNLGAEVTLINEEWKVFLANVRTRKITQVYRAGWVGDYNDANTFLELMHSRFGLNGTGYNNPDYDALVDAAALQLDPNRRQELMQQAEAIFLTDQPAIPLYHYVGKRLVKPYVKGFVGNVMSHYHSKHLTIEVPKKTQQAGD